LADDLTSAHLLIALMSVLFAFFLDTQDPEAGLQLTYQNGNWLGF
jgi:hypothetical protein